VPDTSDSSICTVYLFRTIHPISDFTRFMDGFEKYTRSGICRLCIILKGAVSQDQEEVIYRRVESMKSKFDIFIVRIDDSCLVSEAYYKVSRDLSDKYVCFCNTYSEPIVPDWLEKLSGIVVEDQAGVSGATGAYESTLSETRFPNPSLRTNAYFVSRELYLNLDGVDASDREGALRFESGQTSMTRQILALGKRVVVVNGDGNAFDINKCHEANAFRSVGPQNLLVADNRTRAYDEADEKLKAKLRRFAWEGRKTRRQRFLSALKRAVRNVLVSAGRR